MRHLALECNRRIVLEPIPYSTIALFAGRKPLLTCACLRQPCTDRRTVYRRYLRITVQARAGGLARKLQAHRFQAAGQEPVHAPSASR